MSRIIARVLAVAGASALLVGLGVAMATVPAQAGFVISCGLSGEFCHASGTFEIDE